MEQDEIETLELKLLLDCIYQRYGYDFRQYAKASLTRRLRFFQSQKQVPNLSQMIPRVLHEPGFFAELLSSLSVGVTEMFRDPPIYTQLQRLVLPVLQSYPMVKVWHAGCSSGEEVYSMAIMLKQNALYDRSLIYGTDINTKALKVAKAGIYPDKQIELANQNYRQTGLVQPLTDFYQANHQTAKLYEPLKDNILFTYHNLVTDNVFGEMNLIMCRNVLIYFNLSLQNRVLSLFCDSLCHGGFLCLGSKESLELTDFKDRFEVVAKKERIYKKIG